MPRHLPPSPAFPATRLRRLRQHPWSRALVAECRVTANDLIQPFFIVDGERRRDPVSSMPGIERISIDLLLREAERAARLDLPAIALFPLTPPQRKTADGREAWNEQNLVCRAVRTLKRELPQLGIVCDVALDPYTSHGQDGLVHEGKILNDETLEVLERQALCQAAAGCDVLAPSDMMDGRIGRIRAALDREGHSSTMILAYAAKYASCFYGPFRDAVGSAAALGGADKKTYQMDPANATEALREVALDVAEGADMVMVKPGMPYLDVIHRVKESFGLPTLAYQVSGEYSMIVAAVERGWLDRRGAILESLLALRRAGADAVLSYFAMEAAQLIEGR